LNKSIKRKVIAQEKLFSYRGNNYLEAMFFNQPIIIEPIGLIRTEATDNDVDQQEHLSKVIVSPTFVAALEFQSFLTYKLFFGSIRYQ
jgi:hypothetical protein